MKLVLLKCGICDSWYRPQAHSGHCSHCGSMPLHVGPRVQKYYRLDGMRLIEVVRGIPRHSFTSRNALHIAQTIAE